MIPYYDDSDPVNTYKKQDKKETEKAGPKAKRESFELYGVELNGILDPQGKLHKCRYCYHDTLAENLKLPGGLSHCEEKGWIKLQLGKFYSSNCDWKKQFVCNQAQMNTMLDWAENHGVKLEDIMENWEIVE